MGAAGCAQDDVADEGPRGIVLDLGGRVAVLDDINAKTKIVAERPDGTERLDVYRLTDSRQLASGQILGIQNGSVVAVDPRAPQKAVVLAPATSWFPATTENTVWAVTEEPAATACTGDEIPESVRARFTITEQAISGRPSGRTLTLPCGLQPIAETPLGILAQQTVRDVPASGNAKTAQTRIVVLDTNATAVDQVFDESATILSTAGSRLLWKQDECDGTTCVKAYDTGTKATTVPTCAKGSLVGRGVLDRTGRWYASAIQSDDGTHLAVLDLARNKCTDLGSNPSLSDNNDLNGDVAASWSRFNLLVLDARSGSLTSIDAESGKKVVRDQALDVTQGAQVWGALTK
ncbi:hypothetical protein JS756_34450 [Streptomyces actuosus]|uniref:Uncharacterized protein n=1 Tax=Streptomyces actuosus TaxID=1885 RepID=A0ABS2W1E9_STRAS|nr:hypothetical protein [Streptomyces actuosus]MBN0049094.1 hypothetical protein [Streptomyces actuosus]